MMSGEDLLREKWDHIHSRLAEEIERRLEDARNECPPIYMDFNFDTNYGVYGVKTKVYPEYTTTEDGSGQVHTILTGIYIPDHANTLSLYYEDGGLRDQDFDLFEVKRRLIY